MNILLVTNNLYPTGGDWTYVNSVAQLYRSRGHNVYLFGKRNDRNIDKTYESYYVNGITDDDVKNKVVLFYKVLKNSIYSKEAYRKIGIFLDEFKIDIVQLNSINIGLTPSIINAIKERQIPIVWRILDYKPICPTIYLRYKNEICEDCKGGKYWKCFHKKCKNNSYVDSAAVALESFFYSKRDEYSKVDIFSFQNEFMRRKYIEWGIDEKKTVSINNPYDVSRLQSGSNEGKYVLYFGRLDKPKGVLTFLDAAKECRDIPFVIVGKGDEEELIKSRIKEEAISNVSFLGPIWGEEMERIIDESKLVVVPSEWYEPSPYVVLQSFAHNKPVIASNIGGLPEMVEDDYNGLLFEPRNSSDLSMKIKKIYFDNSLSAQMGENARKTVEERFSPDEYYKKTMELFEKIMN